VRATPHARSTRRKNLAFNELLSGDGSADVRVRVKRPSRARGIKGRALFRTSRIASTNCLFLTVRGVTERRLHPAGLNRLLEIAWRAFIAAPIQGNEEAMRRLKSLRRNRATAPERSRFSRASRHAAYCAIPSQTNLIDSATKIGLKILTGALWRISRKTPESPIETSEKGGNSAITVRADAMIRLRSLVDKASRPLSMPDLLTAFALFKPDGFGCDVRES